MTKLSRLLGVNGINMNHRIGCALVALSLLVLPSVRADDDKAIDIKLTPITLKVESVHPKEALEELSKQIGMPVTVWPENLWNQNYGNNGPATSVTLDIDQKPFWAAMEEICAQTNLFPQNMGNPDVTLQWRGGGQSQGIFGKKPVSASEMGTVVVTQAQRSHTISFDADDPQPNRTCGISIEAYVDPRLRVANYSGSANIEKAEDENGNSIVPPSDNQSHSGMNQASNAWQLGSIFIPLDYEPEKTHKLATLKGSIKMMCAGAVEKFSVEDFANANGKSEELAGRQITLDDVKAEDKSFSVKVTIDRQSMTDQEWQSMFNNIIRGMKVETSSGKRIQLGGGGGGGDKQVSYTLSANWSEEDEKPVKLFWDIPTKFQEVELPFEFKDLTLP
jgi:hypothetical protein